MALQMRMVAESGITLESAYIKIEHTSGNAERQSLIVCIYADENARNEDKSPVDQKTYNFECSVTDDAPNFIKQGYNWMKTTEEYKDAVDILEE